LPQIKTICVNLRNLRINGCELDFGRNFAFTLWPNRVIGKSINDFFERLRVKGALSTSFGLHLNCMDGLRGMAILMVVCGHGFYFRDSSDRSWAAGRGRRLFHLATPL
jgi:hypothetical protein